MKKKYIFITKFNLHKKEFSDKRRTLSKKIYIYHIHKITENVNRRNELKDVMDVYKYLAVH